MALTAELVETVPADATEYPPQPGTVHNTDAHYREIVATILDTAPAGPLSLFAYGSLLWKPAFLAPPSKPARALGWHRSFCIRVSHRRGSPARPGLMMTLDRGGSCQGRLLTLPADRLEAVIDGLVRREMSTSPATNVPRWIAVRSDHEPLTALAFTADRAGAAYVRDLDQHAVAKAIATGVGHWGSCADYLRQTVQHLELLGIRDRGLWRLQRLVADQLCGPTSDLVPTVD